MAKLRWMMVVLLVGAIVFGLGGTYYLFSGPGQDLKAQANRQTVDLQNLKQSKNDLKQVRRPQVSTATHVLEQFMGATWNYRDQKTFDQRSQKASKYATSDVIEHNELFEKDGAQLVGQLKQTSQLDEVQFFPKTVSPGIVTGRVMVTNTAEQGDPTENKKGQQVTGYDVTVNTDSQQITKLKNLGQYTPQVDSDVLAQN